jgi:hypothetical protein
MEEVEGKLKSLMLSEVEMQGVRIDHRGHADQGKKEVHDIDMVISEKLAIIEVLKQTRRC